MESMAKGTCPHCPSTELLVLHRLPWLAQAGGLWHFYCKACGRQVPCTADGTPWVPAFYKPLPHSDTCQCMACFHAAGQCGGYTCKVPGCVESNEAIRIHHLNLKKREG